MYSVYRATTIQLLHSIQNVLSKKHQLTKNENAHLAYKYISPLTSSIDLSHYIQQQQQHEEQIQKLTM